MPYENWFEFKPKEANWRNPTIGDGQPTEGAGNGGIYSFRWNHNSPRWGTFVDVFPDYMGTLADIIPVPWVTIVAASLGFFGTGLDSQWVNEGASFDDHWDKSTSTFSPAKDPTRRSFYRMTATIHIGMEHYFLDMEQYGSDGYVGQLRKTINVEDGCKETRGYFYDIGHPVGPPNPNGGG